VNTPFDPLDALAEGQPFDIIVTRPGESGDRFC
jgi:hypothetical protein